MPTVSRRGTELVRQRKQAARWLVYLSPLIGLLFIACFELVPSQLPAGRIEGQAILESDVPVDARIVGTSLKLRATSAHVFVEADDGGGVGELPVPQPSAKHDPRTTITHLSVAPSERGFAIEIATNRGPFHTEISRDGVRLDDGFLRRMPVGVFGALLIFFGPIALCLLRYWVVIRKYETGVPGHG